LAHKFAFETRFISAEAVSVVAAPNLAHRHKILGTPHTVINDQIHLKGRLSEKQLLQAIESGW